MTDNARELCMGEMREICERDGIKLHMSVRYSPESNGVAERTIGVLTGAVRHATRLEPPEVPMGGGVQHGDIRTQPNANEGIRRTHAV